LFWAGAHLKYLCASGIFDLLMLHNALTKLQEHFHTTFTRGCIVNAVIKAGTLKEGDWAVCGSQYCKVRSLLDEKGKKVTFSA
jgi:hypothetical protein